MELVALPAWFRLEQGWLSIFGLLLDAFGFGLIAFEWFRGYIEMRAKTRIDYWERERAQKRKLRQEHPGKDREFQPKRGFRARDVGEKQQ